LGIIVGGFKMTPEHTGLPEPYNIIFGIVGFLIMMIALYYMKDVF
jgi:hypothetical protein